MILLEKQCIGVSWEEDLAKEKLQKNCDKIWEKSFSVTYRKHNTKRI